MKVPVLIIAFNRPEHVKKVLTAVAAYAPDQLYVFQDGARAGNTLDIELCAQVNAIFEQSLPWECTLKTNFQTLNLGCGRGPSTAISWFFEHVEEGIILEDDCIPHKDFFSYCELMLEKYRANPKISFIGGSSFQPQDVHYPASYYFSSGSLGTWGWATWKRSWLLFDYHISTIDDARFKSIMKTYFKDFRQKLYWWYIYTRVKKDRMNESCWDYQFYFSCWNKGMIAIIPYKNMISNIGYDELATHTFESNHPAANKTTTSIFPIIEPLTIGLQVDKDFYVHQHYTCDYDYHNITIGRWVYFVNRWVKMKTGKRGGWFINR